VALELYNNNFSQDNVKVLEGGISGWTERNTADPTAYPMDP
jgi:hypothetical protein